MSILFRWLVMSLAIFMVPSLVPGVLVRDFGSALAAAAVLSLLNLLVKPVLVFLTLPLTFLTLGLFLLVINALLFQFAGFLVGGLVVKTFWSALMASVLVSIISWIANSVGDRRIAFRVQRPRMKQSKRGRTVDMHRTDDGKWE